MGLGTILSVGGSLLGGLMGKSAADKAAETQANIAQNQLGIEANIHRNTVKRFKPALEAGNLSREALMFELGLDGAPTIGGQAPEIIEFTDTPEVQAPVNALAFPGADPNSRNQGGFGAAAPVTQAEPLTKYRVGDQVFNTREAATQYANGNKAGGTTYGGYELSPDYQYLQEQAMAGLDNSAASRGSLFSGATIKAAQDRSANVASLGRNTYLDRLTGQAQAGQAAAGNMAAAGSNFAAGAGNALSGYGNAVSAGIIGGQNALSTGINNAIGTYNYHNLLANNSGGGIFGNPWGGMNMTPRV